MASCMECKWWDTCHGTKQVGVDCFESAHDPQEVVSLMLAKMGENFEIDVAVEEMAELTKELLKYKRSKALQQDKLTASREHVVEEMADVLFMFEYLYRIFNVNKEEIDKLVIEKAKRTKRRYIDVEE